MCCLVTVLLVFGSRLTILFWWLADPMRFTLAFRNMPLSLPGWLWTLAGLLLLPWTTLAFVFVFPGGILPFEWIILIVALVADMGGYGGGYRNRNYYRR
ncbi:MAG: hypothetical protein AB9891_13860 [Anaerolineaceae bacterium]